MKRISLVILFAWLIGVALPASVAAAESGVSFQEVYELVREQVKDADPEAMNRAAVEGLLRKLDGRAVLADEKPGAVATAALAKVTTFENDVGYVRFQQIGVNAAAGVTEALGALGATNELKGLVLDLRFSAGADYSAAVAVAGLFVAEERPLLDWGQGMVKSKANPDAVRFPVAVLVNRETRGAAEALAGVLRDAGVALILGNPTAGQAFIFRQFPLQTGHKLLIAAGNVKLGAGAELPPTGLQPDIQVNVQPDAERAFLEDPYDSRPPRVAMAAIAPPASGEAERTTRRPRISEADLVRERRDGTNLLNPPTVRERLPEKPQIQDPALARAVDLLKGLAVVRGARS